ncbi:MAG: cation:dicarboxylase symporter family transporter, partial [Thermoanaerobaculia bacterium]
MESTAATPWYKRLHWQILLAMALGTVVGLLWGEQVAPKVGWLGTLFIRLLKMVIVPLIVTSIVSGVSAVGGGRSLGRLFGKTMGYYVLSSTLAILAGLAMVNLIKPGVGANIAGTETAAIPELSTPSSPVDLLLDIVPENVVAAAAKPNMLAMIFFSILLGMSIASLPDRPRDFLVELFESAFQAMMRLTSGVIRFAPLGVFGLITRGVGSSGLESC